MKALVVTAVLVSTATLAGCSGSDMHSDDMKRTITLEQAGDQAKDYVTKAMAALPGNVSIKQGAARNTESKTQCNDENGQFVNNFMANREYALDGLSADQSREAFDTIKSWWKQNDFSVYKDESNTNDEPTVFARNRRGYNMSLKLNGRGEYVLGATSPCVWPNGTPEPSP